MSLTSLTNLCLMFMLSSLTLHIHLLSLTDWNLDDFSMFSCCWRKNDLYLNWTTGSPNENGKLLTLLPSSFSRLFRDIFTNIFRSLHQESFIKIGQVGPELHAKGGTNRQTHRQMFFIIRIRICHRSLKITKKVSLNTVSEASYVYILSGQKFNKNDKKGQFWRVFENLRLAVKQCYQTGHF